MPGAARKTVKVSGTSILTTVDHLSILPLKSANQQARDVRAQTLSLRVWQLPYQQTCMRAVH